MSAKAPSFTKSSIVIDKTLLPTIPEDEEFPVEAEAASLALSCGVVYLAVGKKYVQEAIESARSFRKYNPDIPITIHSDHSKLLTDSYSDLFQTIHHVSLEPMRKGKYKTAPYAKLNKIKAMASFPYDVTLYLDCDTKIRRPIKELFTLGQSYDICIANSPKLDKTRVPYRLVSYRRKGAYNSGVVVFNRNERVTNLFKEWLADCQRDKNIYLTGKGKFYDQPKLVALLNRSNSPIKLKVIPNTVYNVRHTMLKKVKQDGLYPKVKIIHRHK